MKLLHLSDLHLGKRVNEVSILDDQNYILHQILEITDAEHPDAVVIAGDVYDKSVPSGEAVTLFDWFLVALAKRRVPVLLISGNHDSPERLAFGNRLLDTSGIHISPVYSGEVRPITLQDEHGPVHFWLLPFLKPAHVKRFFPDEPIESHTDACRAAITQMNVDFSARNVLVTHQFVTGASSADVPTASRPSCTRSRLSARTSRCRSWSNFAFSCAQLNPITDSSNLLKF